MAVLRGSRCSAGRMKTRDLRWNFIAALVDAAGWGLGFGFVSAATFLPLFVGRLSHAPWAIGLIPAILSLGWYVPGILVAHRYERLPVLRRTVMLIAALERLPLLVMVPLVLTLGPAHRSLLLTGFFLCWTVMSVALGCNSPCYYALIAKTIPATARGRLYGLGGALAGALGVVAGELGGHWIQRYGFPHGYALCFGAAFVIQTVTVLPLGFMREPWTVIPPVSVSRPREPWWRLLRADRNLAWLTASNILFSANLMASAFYTDYAIRHLRATEIDVGHFTSVLMASQAASNLLCGWVGDRSGNRRALQVATVAGIAAAALAPVAPTVTWFYGIFALNQIAATGWGIASMNFVLEMCEPARAPTYTALSTVLSGPFRAVMPMVGAVLALRFGYAPVFALSAALTTLSLFVLTLRVIEPRPVQRRRIVGADTAALAAAGAE
jgi:MFS family permease